MHLMNAKDRCTKKFQIILNLRADSGKLEPNGNSESRVKD